jgi:hypothetical protein
MWGQHIWTRQSHHPVQMCDICTWWRGGDPDTPLWGDICTRRWLQPIQMHPFVPREKNTRYKWKISPVTNALFSSSEHKKTSTPLQNGAHLSALSFPSFRFPTSLMRQAETARPIPSRRDAPNRPTRWCGRLAWWRWRWRGKEDLPSTSSLAPAWFPSQFRQWRRSSGHRARTSFNGDDAGYCWGDSESSLSYTKIKECFQLFKVWCGRLGGETPGAFKTVFIFKNPSFDYCPSSLEQPNKLSNPGC